MSDERFEIGSREEYDYCVVRGYQPLIDSVRFNIPIKLRVEIQNNFFGKFERGIPEANLKFYKWVWEHSNHWCEETMRPLMRYSSVYISHIYSRGSRPEMAHDPRNINILCAEAHTKWEFGFRHEMRIYPANIIRMALLTKEYNEL